jgi:hypothetical protein
VEDALTLFAASLVATGLWFVHLVRRATDWPRALKRKRPTAIAQAKDGELVKLQGSIDKVLEPKMAPLSGRMCAYYQLSVGEINAGGAFDEYLRIEERADFWLSDDSGRALVHTEGAEVVVKRDHRLDARDLPVRLLELLAERGMERLVGRHLTFYEGVLPPGADVALFGMARLEPDPDPSHAAGYRQTAMRVAMRASGEVPLLIHDA